MVCLPLTVQGMTKTNVRCQGWRMLKCYSTVNKHISGRHVINHWKSMYGFHFMSILLRITEVFFLRWAFTNKNWLVKIFLCFLFKKFLLLSAVGKGKITWTLLFDIDGKWLLVDYFEALFILLFFFLESVSVIWGLKICGINVV